MVKKINASLMNAGPLVSIDGVVIHNDAGSGSAEWYVEWLKTRDKNLGIAHYYITKDTIARVIDTNLIGYHTGHWPSNQRYIGYEVCQSVSAKNQDFLANEDMVLMQAAEDLLFYGLPINGNTVRVHHEFVPTSCPHRSMALHGGTTESVKNYFIERISYFASIGKTVEISIHAPAKGATFVLAIFLFAAYHFNPRTREGCDKEHRPRMSVNLISIHAPAKGATDRCK